ncbi:MAG: hypothetical protein JWQ96_1987 [Segetibacter sp.]|nr:hypothetical protein [Segetibacter sp.]
MLFLTRKKKYLQDCVVINHEVYTKRTVRLAFLTLLVALFVLNDARLMVAVYESDSPSVFLIIPVYMIGFCSIGFLLFNRNIVVRTIGQILLFSSVYTDALYLILGGFPFSYPDAINLFNNPGFAGGALATFVAAFVFAFFCAAIIYACFHLLSRKIKLSFSPGSFVLFITIPLLLYFLPQTYPVVTDFLPSVHRLTGNLINANKSRPEEQWRRAGVSAVPLNRKVQHVFIIVDESITGTALSINGFHQSTTPFIQKNASRFINFGLATSFTNFSAGTNLSLISGMLQTELPDVDFKAFLKPSIFQFAKSAGYKTFLLDAQTVGGNLQNYLTPKDLRFIDGLFQPGHEYPSVAYYLRDSILAEKMVEIANSNTPTFVYVNKAGAHWPYHTNFPENLSNKFLLVNNSEVNNASNYLKSIYWNVDRFWERLLKKLDTSSHTLIIYTSDHGEDYASAAYRVKHASIYKSSTTEGKVPLFIFDNSNFFPANFFPPVNRYSHQYIFPTLLKAMGYYDRITEKHYGRSLLEQPYSAARWFQSGDLFGRGKNKRIIVD